VTSIPSSSAVITNWHDRRLVGHDSGANSTSASSVLVAASSLGNLVLDAFGNSDHQFAVVGGFQFGKPLRMHDHVAGTADGAAAAVGDDPVNGVFTRGFHETCAQGQIQGARGPIGQVKNGCCQSWLLRGQWRGCHASPRTDGICVERGQKKMVRALAVNTVWSR